MTKSFSKEQRRIINSLVQSAYSRELTMALADLEASFKEWRAGDIDPFELKEKIHDFHDGESRAIWKRYHRRKPMTVLPVVVAEGVIREDELPSDILNGFRDAIESCRRGLLEEDE